jgi:hypothetical protein
MIPRLHPQPPRLESSIELRDTSDAGPRVVDPPSDEPLSSEDEKRRRAYADWLARFDKTAA